MSLDTSRYLKEFSESYRITSDYNVLLYHDQPVLFTGINKFGSRVVGSLFYEDEDIGKDYHLFTLVTQEQYTKFARKEISYRSILDESLCVYLTESWSGMDPFNIYVAHLSQLPQSMLPTYQSFIFKPILPDSRTLTIVASGSRDTSNHLIDPHTANIIIGDFDYILNNTINSLIANTDKRLITRLGIPEVSSYKFNFHIAIFEKNPHLLIKNKDIRDMIGMNIHYMFNDYINEYAELYSLDSTTCPAEFSKVYNDSLSILQIPEDPEAKFRELMKRKYTEAAVKISDIADAVSVDKLQVDISSNNILLGRISKSNIHNFVTLNDNIEKITDDTFEETEYKEYQIQIFSLNSRTGKGSAYVRIASDSEEKCSARIHIVTEDSLDHTKYTESEHLCKEICVEAKATRSGKDNRITKLKIRLD